jgi:Amt family ammonium transporter
MTLSVRPSAQLLPSSLSLLSQVPLQTVPSSVLGSCSPESGQPLFTSPVASWVWGGGWIMELGTWFGTADVIDYAGGTAVHINAGAAALALAIVLGKRFGFAKGIMQPHNVPLVLLGAALLWFGWFGFNVGAEFLNNMENVGLITVNTLGATAAAILGWLAIEKVKEGKATSIGAASGAVAGLVAITPACANVTPFWALVLGVLAGVLFRPGSRPEVQARL